MGDPKADITVRRKPDWPGYSYTVRIKVDGTLLRSEKGWRPTAEWATALAKRKSKRLVRAERRRQKRVDTDEAHIDSFDLRP